MLERSTELAEEDDRIIQYRDDRHRPRVANGHPLELDTSRVSKGINVDGQEQDPGFSSGPYPPGGQ